MARSTYLVARPAALALLHGACGLALLCCAAGAQAGQASAPLLVRVDLKPAATRGTPERVFCSSGLRNRGSVITVCSTGAVITLGPPDRMGLLWMPGGARPALVNFGAGLPTLGWLSAPALGGAVTGWQLLRHADSDYVEMTLGW